MIKLAIDVMGGDDGVEPLIKGFEEAYKLRGHEFEPVFVGDEKLINSHLSDKYKKFQILHTAEFIAMSDNATDSLRKKNSSIYKAINLHKLKEVDGVISAGHSGATMSLATLRIGRIKGVIRPALAVFFPNTKKDGKTLVLDLGANTDCKSEHLYQFALMGKEYMKDVYKNENPKVGLLSNGEEESKGNEVTKQAFDLLKGNDFFKGNVEGSDLFNGSIDVVVCDGFIGNLVLKTSEGVSSAIKSMIKSAIMNRGILSKLGALLMRNVFKDLKKRTDYAEYGGAPLLGINGCVIVSHGKSNAKAIKNAIFQAIDFNKSEVNHHILNSFNKESIK